MATTDTTKETSMPASKITRPPPVRLWPCNKYFTSFKKLAPNMVGMARTKENSAATGRAQQSKIPPKIVAPEREVPGMRDKIWKAPMSRAVL